MTDEQFKRKLEKIKKQGERYKQEKELQDMYAEYMPEKKERKVSNIMLTIIVVAIVLYTVASFWIQYVTGMEISSTLTGCFYAFWGTEVAALAAIKTSKVKHEVEDEEDFR